VNGDAGHLLVGQADPATPPCLCGCCQGRTAATPAGVSNRPGLSAIAYRVGTHSRFKASMLARLSSADLPALAHLRTRDDDDFTIALLDAWATVADVLTFYQERIANEGYLRTASERLSIVELARLIGYRPRPGVAAATYLAFTLEEAAGAPEQAVSRTTIDRGVQVRSVPGPGERPQTFETAETLESRLAWSVLRPRTTRAVVPVAGDTSTYLKGTATNLKPGDAVLLVGSERENNPGREEWDFRRLTRVTPDVATDRTRVDWTPGLGSEVPPMPPSADPRVYAFRLRASLFGYNAPDPRVLPAETRTAYQLGTATEWTFTITNRTIDLDTVYPGLAHGSWLVLSRATAPYQELYRVTSVGEGSVANYAMTGKTTRLELDTDENLTGFDGGNYRETAVFAQSERLELAETPITEPVWGSAIELDRLVEGLEAGRRLIVRGRRPRVTVAGGPLTVQSAADPGQATTVPAGTTFFVLAEPSPPTAATRLWRLRDAAGAEWTAGVTDSAFTLAAPARSDEVVAEVATLKEAERVDDGHTRLVLEAPLANAYDRLATAEAEATVVHANVVLATHGETVGEVLGSGDGSAPFQRFRLKQTPLTFVSAPTPSGAASSLVVRVDDVQWHERPSFYGGEPKDRTFVTETDDAGVVTVLFGDGRTGARLPSGENNVRATYRKGIGIEGNLRAGQLSLLADRPLGVKGVVSPLPATGGADPETREAARQGAPITVLTLDRAVSLRDYEDFARSFGGGAIAKALATWSWNGLTRRVLITVAGPGGLAIPDGSPLHGDLVDALKAAGDPFVEFEVKSYRSALFRLGLKVKVHPDHLEATVLAAVEVALRATFGFARRAFGQAVALSEIMAAAHAVPGVVAVDVDLLRRLTPPVAGALVDFRLPAAPPELGPDGTMLPAELLTLDPAPLARLETMP
jgi:hypothetical protein